MSAWHWLSWPLLLGQLGCTVAAASSEEDARPKNSCSSQDGCGRGESCVGGLCQSLNGELESVLLTASPAAESPVPNLTFVMHLADTQTTGGAKDLVWPGSAVVTGSLVLPNGHCYPEFVSDDPNRTILPSTDGTLPVTATFSLRQRWLGLSPQTYYAKTVAAPVTLTGYTFDLQVPSGEYDVYLVPPKRQKGACVVPPQLFRRVPIGVEDNVPNGVYRFNLATVSSLELHFLWPQSSPSLIGWTADILEPLGGNPISTEVVLGPPGSTRGMLDYSVPLAYSAVTERTGAGNVDAAREFLRLRPPSGVVAPTIYLERSALGLLQNQGEPVNVTIFTQYPLPVTVRGQLVTQDDRRPTAGELTFVSQTIYGVDAGVFGFFQTTVNVGDDGVLEVPLPPGKYFVQAVPPVLGSGEEALSALQVEWDVPADIPIQFGKLLELSRAPQITGQSRAQRAQVQAAPVKRTVRPFDEAFGVEPFSARSIGGFVDEAGRFVLPVDELRDARVNLTVLAPQELGFGWFVRTGLELGMGDQDLGRLALPLPAVIAGQASVLQDGANVALGSAAIRAYAYLDKDYKYTRDPDAAESIVPVAETRADPDGAFRLLLPSTIDAPK